MRAGDDRQPVESARAEAVLDGGHSDQDTGIQHREQKSAIEAGRIYKVQWQVKEAGAEFDIWIDDIQFFGCGK